MNTWSSKKASTVISDSEINGKNLFQSSMRFRYILNLSRSSDIKKLSKYHIENDIDVVCIIRNLNIYFINFFKFTIVVLFYYLNFRTNLTNKDK